MVVRSSGPLAVLMFSLARGALELVVVAAGLAAGELTGLDVVGPV